MRVVTAIFRYFYVLLSYAPNATTVANYGLNSVVIKGEFKKDHLVFVPKSETSKYP